MNHRVSYSLCLLFSTFLPSVSGRRTPLYLLRLVELILPCLCRYPSFSNIITIVELGDKHVQENPALLSLGVLFFRWHNYLVDKLDSQKHHGFDETFSRARQWVIASLQVCRNQGIFAIEILTLYI